MNHEDAERWRQALSAYRYPVARDRIVRFAKRIDAAAPWFNFDLSSGTRGETIDFEQRFRSFGPKAIEPWFEVIFWKLASMSGRGESKAAEMIEGLSAINAQAPKLWSACANFVGAGSQKSFETLQDELFIVTKSIPVAATFSAFMCPERFPMVDSWIAKWVVGYRAEYSAEGEASGLAAPSESFLARRKTTLTLPGDWPFYEGWIQFCRMAASILTQQTGFPWRARDIEMAAFQNARSASPLLPAVV